MTNHKREITEDQYNRGMQNHRYVDPADKEDIFSAAELYGYGVYGGTVIKEDDGKYYVLFSLGSTCD